MALQLPVLLPNGSGGNYIRVLAYEVHPEYESAYAQLALFINKDQSDAAPKYPLAIIGILNLRGAEYLQYFSKTALQAVGYDIFTQFYTAAKQQPVTPVNGMAVENLANAVDV